MLKWSLFMERRLARKERLPRRLNGLLPRPVKKRKRKVNITARERINARIKTLAAAAAFEMREQIGRIQEPGFAPRHMLSKAVHT